MKIEVAPGVFWDTKTKEQSPEAMEWYHTEVLPKRDETEPLYDKWGRPYLWVIDMGTCIVEIERIYVSPGYSWAMKTEVVTVKPKKK